MNRVKDQLENNPHLQKYLSGAIAKAYPKAVSLAVKETGLVVKTFPQECPYLIEQLQEIPLHPPPLLKGEVTRLMALPRYCH